jgi:hypothetical protein
MSESPTSLTDRMAHVRLGDFDLVHAVEVKAMERVLHGLALSLKHHGQHDEDCPAKDCHACTCGYGGTENAYEEICRKNP